MSTIRTKIVENLHSLSDEVLDEITADGHTFARASWYRLLDSMDLSSIVGGDVHLQYAVVTCDEIPVCVAPILRARGPGVYFAYSLRRFYFEHWIEDAIRLNPDNQQTFARIMTGVSCYRRLLDLTGTPLTDAIIVTSPLSYRGDIPVAPSASVPRHVIYASLVRDLQTQARRRNVPLWFFAMPSSGNRLGKVLDTAGCGSNFLFYDNCIDLEDFQTFEEYLQSFRRTTRRAFCRDIQRTEQAGITLRFTSDFAGLAPRLSELYTQTYSKYGSSYFRHGDDFWNQIGRLMPGQAELIVAEKDSQVVGFSVLLQNERRGESWTYRIGRTFDGGLEGVPYYFALSFYGPIRRAIEKGYRRIWLGPASYEAKSVRGARLVPLHNYFWFPRRWDRWFLQPYLKLFGQISEKEITQSLQKPETSSTPTKAIPNRQEQ